MSKVVKKSQNRAVVGLSRPIGLTKKKTFTYKKALYALSLRSATFKEHLSLL